MTAVRSSRVISDNALRARSHRWALDLLGASASAPGREEFLRIVMPGLHDLLQCDEVGFADVSASDYRIVSTCGYPTPMSDVPQAARLWLARPRDHPWLDHLARHRDPHAARLTDLMPRVDFTRSLYYVEFYRPRRLRFADFATISTANHRLVGISLGRELRDFGPREHELFEQLRRPLGGIWRGLGDGDVTSQLAALAAWGTSHDVALTPAELRVVGLLLTGRSNRAIAAELHVSTKAVEQHLTRVYRRFHVDTRIQLALLLKDASSADERPGQASQ
ncbi:helix-turn-helix transcriptional regulator [Jatrophihabitans telluris]|uniref:Helix-turn-helix transcriptional regulator n=1 Tax=Jatrophihabitans telluris TaxID=2038343 RepID=A0ABY4QZ55_9ACTN|nr:helix-turn-helix transcriptional regulator [Jatrophihabitans telluris]UQX88694.1 helix-turn-helix transcriptional regulator [Jatrophihabitans telluris]